MIVKSTKSEAWKQSNPNRLGLLLHPRYSSRDSVGIHRILTELPYSSKLEPRNPVGLPTLKFLLITKSFIIRTRRFILWGLILLFLHSLGDIFLSISVWESRETYSCYTE
jgi:hypothetical protein